jgi:hypothetical protein
MTIEKTSDTGVLKRKDQHNAAASDVESKQTATCSSLSAEITSFSDLIWREQVSNAASPEVPLLLRMSACLYRFVDCLS